MSEAALADYVLPGLAGAILIALYVRRWDRLLERFETPVPMFLALIAVVFAVWQAETPLGVGNGRVPDVVGRSSCDAEDALAERGIRWRYRDSQKVQSQPADGGDGEPACDVDPITDQRPPAGRSVSAGEPVVMQSFCRAGGGCE